MSIEFSRPCAALLGVLVLPACQDPPAGDTDSDTAGHSTTGSGSDPGPGSGSGSSSGDTEPTTGTPLPPDEVGPREGPWEVVVDELPFPLADIERLTVGRKEFDENFANRGVVEVLFDHEAETITIEARKYVFGDAVDSDSTFAHLSLWTFVIAGNPVRPSLMDPADDCSVGAWKDDCGIYAYYDGKSQPWRSGIDLRVHLPLAYRGQLLVETQDNDAEDDWPRRGDVTIDGLCGSGQVDLEAGRADIRMCRDLSPAPTCAPADVLTCAGFPDGSGSEAWSPDCPCGTDLFGQLLIRAPQPWAANVTVDVPDDLWLSATLQNTEAMKPHECLPQFANCSPGVCVLDDSDPFGPSAEFNYPSAAAPAGAGFSISAVSGGCTLIPFVEAGDAPQTPVEELRGLLRLCTDCL